VTPTSLGGNERPRFAGSALVGLYVLNFSNYDAVSGPLAGVMVFLVWLWVTNSALLLGAALDAVH
jgi:membrane protein